MATAEAAVDRLKGENSATQSQVGFHQALWHPLPSASSPKQQTCRPPSPLKPLHPSTPFPIHSTLTAVLPPPQVARLQTSAQSTEELAEGLVGQVPAWLHPGFTPAPLLAGFRVGLLAPTASIPTQPHAAEDVSNVKTSGHLNLS